MFLRFVLCLRLRGRPSILSGQRRQAARKAIFPANTKMPILKQFVKYILYFILIAQTKARSLNVSGLRVVFCL